MFRSHRTRSTLYQWQNEQTDRCNADGSDTLTSIASKLEIYAIFSLLLALADWACGGEKKLIDVDTVERGNFRTFPMRQP